MADELVKNKRDPNKLSASDTKISDVAMRVSTGDPDNNETKTSGIKMRGSGAAIKGFTSRGPMG